MHARTSTRRSFAVVATTLTLAIGLLAAPAGADSASPSPACIDWNSPGWDSGYIAISHTNRTFAAGETVWVREHGAYTGAPTGIFLEIDGVYQSTALGSGVTLSYEIPADGQYDYYFRALPIGYNGVYWEVGCTPAVSDSDGDGVLDGDDICDNTSGPDAPDSPKKNRFYVDGTGAFVDSEGSMSGYSIHSTFGCDEDQIIDLLGLGVGHARFGVPRGILEEFVATFGS